MRSASRGLCLGRRAALTLPLATLGGCSLFDDLFFSSKTPLPGRREVVAVAHSGLVPPSGTPPRVVLPAVTTNADWPQAGDSTTHLGGNLAIGARPSLAWRAAIGEGGGYRRKITSQPVVAGGRVYAMDSDAVVSAFDVATGRRLWRLETQGRKDRSTNIGGGIAVEAGSLYASTGRAELLALDATSGKLKWRQPLGGPARSTPTIADGRIFVTTISQQLLALSATDGAHVWSFQASVAGTTMLGAPAPAYTDGLVVAGFGSGDLAAVRAATGGVAWTDSIASAAGRTSLADLSAITGMPVIDPPRVYATGLGGLLVAIDLRAGRRLWEREVASSQTPWVAGEWMFILTADQQLAALSTGDGGVAWLVELPRYANQNKQTDPVRWLGPVLAGNRLLVVGTNARALWLSPANGDTLATVKLPAAASVAPIVAGGTAYLVTDDGSLLAFR